MLRVVLVWINGPFGVGKTHTADEIQRRLAGSIICDPEHLGYGLHRMTPPHLRGDFQDFRTWRKGTLEVLERLLDRHEGDVIVPVTIIEPAYLAEILGPLRENGHQVRHYALRAERATILRRIRGRSLPRRPDTWAEGKIDECLDRLGHDDFAEHIRTDGGPHRRLSRSHPYPGDQQLPERPRPPDLGDNEARQDIQEHHNRLATRPPDPPRGARPPSQP
jgi:hypothetical protein